MTDELIILTDAKGYTTACTKMGEVPRTVAHRPMTEPVKVFRWEKVWNDHGPVQGWSLRESFTWTGAPF